MAKKSSKKSKASDFDDEPKLSTAFSPRTGRIVGAIVLLLVAFIIILGAFDAAGIAGRFLYETILQYLFGFGVIIIPVLFAVLAIHLFRKKVPSWGWLDYTSATVLFLSILGLMHVIAPNKVPGGLVGEGIGNFIIHVFDVYAGAVVLGALGVISFLTLFSYELHLLGFLKKLFTKQSAIPEESYEVEEDEGSSDASDEEDVPVEKPVVIPPAPISKPVRVATPDDEPESFISGAPAPVSVSYEYPPLSLLNRSSGKPAVGDIKANANLIQRTLLNFGIDVEMDEVTIGPTVTRYALKPAEGIKLARIVALKSDLALALAAHPIRIEAPIPGKSLVGIEIPNRTNENVGLGTLLSEGHFENSPDRLTVALGKKVAGKSAFGNLAKMPHLLIAGTTGSGKSVTMHNLILSLLYKNGPEDLRLILIDPKRVELTLYNDIPHLLTPVIKESKKAILSLKWAAKEMERRYELLEKTRCRDIQSYHKNVQGPAVDKGEMVEKMPYIVICIEELADIMQAYPRELESGIVRIAQMARAVGIHLILSTQRPSVNVITGLIKANIPSRLALQVASQIDSRTILDAPGAESLLGKGDMLYQGEGMAKPERMQCANVDEEQVKSVVNFIKKHNSGLPDEISLGETLDNERSLSSSDIDDADDDELYEDARAVVMEAGKASTSYIQRKLKVGYSRAARLIDLLEERGVIGPADGAKPREVLSGGESGLSTGVDSSRLNNEDEV